MSIFNQNKRSLAEVVKRFSLPLHAICFGIGLLAYSACQKYFLEKNIQLHNIDRSIELLSAYPSLSLNGSAVVCDDSAQVVTTTEMSARQLAIDINSISNTDTDILINVQNQQTDKMLEWLSILSEKHPCLDVEQLNLYSSTDKPEGFASGTIRFKNTSKR
ncbi:MAG TPA: hypothetical protein VIZ65_07150 [Cellvibrionaceae bacterium]